ncbi:MAG: META domain-containing protein [Woeseia sp.]
MNNKTKKLQKLAAGMLSALILFVTGCAGGLVQDPEIVNQSSGPQALYDVVWQVEDIDKGGIIDSSHITMQMSPEGRASGSTGCNRYFGTLTVGQTSFEVSGAGSTRMACAPAIMQQETRFLQALQDVRRYKMDGDFVRLFDESGDERMRMIRTNEEPAS